MTPSSSTPTPSSAQRSHPPQRFSPSSSQATQRTWTWAPIDPANSHLRWERRPLDPEQPSDPTPESGLLITRADRSLEVSPSAKVNNSMVSTSNSGFNTSSVTAHDAMEPYSSEQQPTTEPQPDTTELAIVVYDPARTADSTNNYDASTSNAWLSTVAMVFDVAFLGAIQDSSYGDSIAAVDTSAVVALESQTSAMELAIVVYDPDHTSTSISNSNSYGNSSSNGFRSSTNTSILPRIPCGDSVHGTTGPLNMRWLASTMFQPSANDSGLDVMAESEADAPGVEDDGHHDDADVVNDDTAVAPVEVANEEPQVAEPQRPRLANRLKIKPIRPKVYAHNTKRQHQDAEGKARRRALEDKAATTAKTSKTATTEAAARRRTAKTKPSVASRLFDYLQNPVYLAHRAKCKARRAQDTGDTSTRESYQSKPSQPKGS
ncbi:hypothetical protein PHYBOEH_005919 [Phytophthora boehmeriae]|uniref:Uncharacterized protein n=1 Tax=Phytophthora boehmeriae TaxID=109152 RepID=A0A8T1WQN4_9STRA|nr:hypothetical protein PHYBOEH_005919 [Phytophthora boehmeriae]